ncbi:MAG: SAM-dependent methyltransferase, partial [Rhizobiaceae bacterium]
IQMHGPMPLADYMTLCLTHPEHGYYTTGNPVGGRASAQRQAGDFITAPEVSQMFGELLGVWCMEMWQALGSPPSFNLVEIGPGRGTLMQDLLRISDALSGFKSACHVHLIEVSPTLSEQQSLTLSSAANITWLRDIDDLTPRPTLILANELLDALPFRQWCKNGEEWFERAVGLIDDQLAFVLRPNQLDKAELPEDHSERPQATLFETAPAREAFVSRIADFLRQQSGAALLIDYGHLKSGFGDTFQAVRDHAFADPLTGLGQTDLTSHVDFAPLCAIARANDCEVPEPVTQGEFLLALGLLERAGALGTGHDTAVHDRLHQAVERLAGPSQMGDLFKVMAFGAASDPAGLTDRWPGFS